MRWPRPRFTVRRLMIAVVIVALMLRAIFWVAEMRARSAAFRRRADELVWSTRRSGSGIIKPNGRWAWIGEDENTRLEDAWALRLAAKYYRLSYHPWSAVEPDPPRPKPLDHPRSTLNLPDEVDSEGDQPDPGPPTWIFLWTWRNAR